MVKIDTLLKERKISRISDLEIERYVNFFSSSYKDNLAHSSYNLESFPRWSIISGYYAMHDITKLLIAKKFRIKIDFEVHKTAIELFRELIKDKKITSKLELGYKEFIQLANDLAEAKKERTKVQYYTGTSFLKEEYKKRAKEFYSELVLEFIKKLEEMVK